MSSIVIRIKEYIDFKGISIAAFERSVGFSNSSFSSQYKNNKSIGSDKIENIIKVYPEINPVWLLTGEGSMIKENSTPNNIVNEPTVEYTHEKKADYWLQEKIDNLMDDNSRNSRSIEKMVDTADRNSRMLEKMIGMLEEKGLNVADSIEIQKGASDSTIKGKTKLTDKDIISK